ncbi:metal ABC transporter substrate-binding protein [Streptomyces sp. XM4193]|uniref:zinc ABC transporter substrate-binding protein AztC n=1 Tax=Streptomyces sp. XM4193 TaxID=2929782 RepID=UPI001FFB5AFD|nr:zinc ABC transporter substrate-binding protein AztC [Streptomyces sp. XM4193]MCK1796222.1 metal ABC transporter substrate-binding protein [Streptomyces sp. XM4193]
MTAPHAPHVAHLPSAGSTAAQLPSAGDADLPSTVGDAAGRTATVRRAARGRGPVLALLLFALAAPALLAGCGTGSDREPTIVVTTNILGDLTRNVVGEEAEVKVLMKPGADPHSFGVSARQAAELEQADLVVHNGLGLEENVQRHVDAAKESGVPALAVGEEVDPLPYRSDASKGEPDPHFWTDPVRVAEAVRVLTEEIVEQVDGVDHKRVRANAAAYGKRVDALQEWTDREFAKIPRERRSLVTNHHVFGYLAERYDFRVVGAVVPSGTTLASPSAADLKSLADAIDRAGVPAIFVDSGQPDRLAQVLRDEAELDVRVVPLFTESLTARGGGAATYLQMARANAEAISEGLRRP